MKKRPKLQKRKISPKLVGFIIVITIIIAITMIILAGYIATRQSRPSSDQIAKKIAIIIVEYRNDVKQAVENSNREAGFTAYLNFYKSLAQLANEMGYPKESRKILQHETKDYCEILEKLLLSHNYLFSYDDTDCLVIINGVKVMDPIIAKIKNKRNIKINDKIVTVITADDYITTYGHFAGRTFYERRIILLLNENIDMEAENISRVLKRAVSREEITYVTLVHESQHFRDKDNKYTRDKSNEVLEARAVLACLIDQRINLTMLVYNVNSWRNQNIHSYREGYQIIERLLGIKIADIKKYDRQELIHRAQKALNEL